MALVECPECKTEVSDTALKCTKCGVQLRKPKRSFFGKLVKWGLIIFNIVMLVWLIGGMNSATEGMQAMDEAQRAGTAIGAGIGGMIIAIIWAVGDVIGGIMFLVTRPNS